MLLFYPLRMNFSSSQIKLFSIVGGILVMLFLVFLVFGRGPGAEKQTISLKIWGVGDTQADMQPVIGDFINYAKSVPQFEGVTFDIQYREWREDEYERLLLDQLAEGDGPDIMFIHNTWLPKYYKKLLPLPADQMTLDQFREQFVPVTATDLIYDRKIYALPHYVDTLALYYNTQQFQSGNSNSSRPSTSWTNFKNQVAAMTNKNGTIISRSGSALGTAKNIKYATDILYTYILQRNGKVCRDETCNAVMLSDNREVRDALEEYVSYSDPTSATYVWDSDYLKGLENNNIFQDIDAFIRGRVSSFFGYASDYDQIVTLGKVNNLKFDVAEIPQSDEAVANNEKVAFANYWAPAVSKDSKQPQLAWDFIKFMTSKVTLGSYYERHPRPPSREDMIDTGSENPLRVFHRQAKFAASLVLFDKFAFDAAFADGIEQVAIKSSTSFNTLRKLENDLNAIIAPYFQVLGDKVTDGNDDQGN